MHTLVTSFTQKGYNEYADRFLETFREFWPKSVKLVIYYEGEAYPEEDSENVEWRRIEEVMGWKEWMETVSRFPYMCGKTPSGYDIQHDARMVRKPLMEIHACNIYGGRVAWIDADMITHEPVTEDWLYEVMPKGKFCAFCGRDGWFYTESGFLMFDSEHPMYATFMRAYWEIFWSGLFLTLKGWHDCYGFDAVRHAIDAPENFVDLSSHLPRGTMHPLVNSILGEKLDHRKGPRKASRSGKEDLVVERKEIYWQES